MAHFENDTLAVVALGGGHGMSASLKALRHVSNRLSAIITVADDGGSSGRLRSELKCLPPGDLRMALAALCDDTDWGKTWSAVLQKRFHSEGCLDGHAIGNLLIAGLWEMFPDPVTGLDWVGRLLNARGRVLPMSAVPLTVGADVISAGGIKQQIVGQSQVAKSGLPIDHLWLEPVNPPAAPEALKAIRDADWVVLGPGSWYTSVIVHLLVPELAAALHDTSALRLVTVNLEADKETAGLGVVNHLEVFRAHAPDLRIDAVLVDPSSISSREDLVAVREAARALGAKLVVRPVATDDGQATHDPLKLAAAYREIFSAELADPTLESLPETL